MDHSSFCKNCCEIVPFNVVKKKLSCTTNGVPYSYDKKVCLCEKCGNEVYVFDITNENIEASFAAYYEAKDALTPSQEIHAQ